MYTLLLARFSSKWSEMLSLFSPFGLAVNHSGLRGYRAAAVAHDDREDDDVTLLKALAEKLRTSKVYLSCFSILVLVKQWQSFFLTQFKAWFEAFVRNREHSLTFVRGSINVQLTSCLTGLDSTKQVNMFLIQHQQNSFWMSLYLIGC